MLLLTVKCHWDLYILYACDENVNGVMQAPLRSAWDACSFVRV